MSTRNHSRLPSQTAIAAIAFALSSPLLSQEAALQVNWTQDPVNGHWYGVGYEPQTWQVARNAAVASGVRLAEIYDQGLNDRLLSVVTGQEHQSGPPSFWLGATDQTTEGTWEWESGTPFGFSNWAPGEPSGGQSQEDYAAFAVRSWGGSISPGLWNDDWNAQRPLVESSGEPVGTYAWPQPLPTGGQPRWACLGDVDGNAQHDFVVPCTATERIDIFELDAGNWVKVAEIDTDDYGGPVQTRIADINGDGALDIIATHWQDNKVVTYLRTPGSWIFSPSIITSVDDQPNGLVTLDFNSDGATDFAVPSATGNSVAFWKNMQQGSFSHAYTVDLSSGGNSIKPYRMNAEDFNADGIADILVACQDSNEVIVLSSSIGPQPNHAVSTRAQVPAPGQIAIGHLWAGAFGGDLHAAVASADGSLTLLNLFSNNGVASAEVESSTPPLFAPESISRGICIRDLNSDGLADVAIAGASNSLNGGGIRTLLNTGNSLDQASNHYLTTGTQVEWLGATWNGSILSTSFGNDGAYLNARFFDDCDGDGLPDQMELDCDADGIPDSCQILIAPNLDQDLNGILDSCEATEPILIRYGPSGRLFTAIGPETWLGARTFGVQNDLYLATVEDGDLGTWLRQTFDLPGYWIGYHDVAVEGQFEWSSLRAVSYENWAPGAPNDLLSDQDFTAVDGSTGLWDTHFANSTFPAIMETISIDCDGNLILDDEEIAADPRLDLDGDGQLDMCVSPNYCVGGINSTGMSGVIGVSGSPFLSDNDLTLEATQLPPGQWSYFVMSASQAYVPGFGGSQGNLCVGPPIVRFNQTAGPGGQIAQTSATGTRNYTLDFANLPQQATFQPGETWNFQLWFRDQNPGLTSNTTDGISVMFR